MKRKKADGHVKPIHALPNPLHDRINSRLHSHADAQVPVIEKAKTNGTLKPMPSLSDPLHDRIIFWGRARLVAQTERIAWGHRLRKLVEKGYESEAENPDFVKTMAETQAAFEAFEAVCDKQLVALMKSHPLAPWIKAQRGFGLSTAGQLLGVTGSLDHFATVSALWAFLGLHTVGGRAPRRIAGQKSNWNPRGRVIGHLIGESINKANARATRGENGKWCAHYDRKRTEYLARQGTGPSGCPFGHVHHSKSGDVLACLKTDDEGKVSSGHVQAAALRYAVKMLVAAMWSEWRRLNPKPPGWVCPCERYDKKGVLFRPCLDRAARRTARLLQQRFAVGQINQNGNDGALHRKTLESNVV